MDHKSDSYFFPLVVYVFTDDVSNDHSREMAAWIWSPSLRILLPGRQSAQQTKCTEFLLRAQHSAGCHETLTKFLPIFLGGRQDRPETRSKRALCITACMLI